MSVVARWVLLSLGVVTFLVAAKAHGRQLRLERELMGYWRVSFGGLNPPWVDALWRRERFAFWILEGGLASVTVCARALVPEAWCLPLAGVDGEGGLHGGLLFHVLLPPTAAFLATGFLSVCRCALRPGGEWALTAAMPSGWRAEALKGSAGWWLLALVMTGTLVVCAWTPV